MRERLDMFQNSAEGNTHDPCSQPYEVWGSRAAVLTICLLTMLLGSIAVYYWLQDFSFRLQAATVVCDTAAVILYTFSKNRGNNPPYLYSCPIVQSQFPRLIRSHALFLFGIVVLETGALELRLHLSNWWLTSTGKNETPFNTVLAILIGTIVVVQITTNRSLLERAHSEQT
jgi:hypothetical protein